MTAACPTGREETSKGGDQPNAPGTPPAGCRWGALATQSLRRQVFADATLKDDLESAYVKGAVLGKGLCGRGIAAPSPPSNS